MLTSGIAGGQQITQMEYFIDSLVPGQGTVITVTPDDTIETVITVNTAGLSPGIHAIIIRAYDSSGLVSHYQVRWVLVDALSSNNPVDAWEWFANNDPGVGNGAVMVISPMDTFDATVSLNTDTLATGANRIYLRPRAANGKWGHYLSRTSLVDKVVQSLKVTDLEYFTGADPGVGAATNLNVPPADTIDELVTAQTDTLALGNYILSMRAKNEAGHWSHAMLRAFKVCTIFGPKSIFDAHVNRNKVTFTNNSTHSETHEWEFGDGNTDAVQVNPVHTFVPGVYDVCLTSNNICGSDTLCQEVIVPGLSKMFPPVHANEGMLFSDVYGAQQEAGSDLRLFNDSGIDIMARKQNYVDHTHMQPVFALHGEPPGVYHLEVTHPGGLKDTLLNAITLEPSTGHDLWVELPGPDRVLINRTYNTTFLIGNKGNQTAFGVPLYIKAHPGTQIAARNIKYQDSIPAWVRDSVTDFSYWEDPYTGDTSQFGTFMISWVRPGDVVAIDVSIRHTSLGSKPLEYYLIPPQYEYWELDSLIRSGCGMPPCLRCALDILSIVPILGCATGAAGLLCDIAGGGGGSGWGMALSIAGTIASCTPTPASLLLGIVQIAASGASAVAGAGASSSCGPGGCNPQPKDKKPYNSVGSLDPNIKVGPTGFTSENYTRGNDPFVYGIYFENADTASAPANEVILTDTLDMNLFDLSTFRFVNFGFGDTNVSVMEEPELQFFIKDVDLQPVRPTVVRVTGELDTATGVVRVHYASLDPDTMDLVSDPLHGFLPPNVVGPEGEGFVQFMVSLKSGIQHLDVIENEASIIFDANAPIITPAWVNTIDRVAPQSAVNPLPVQIEDTIIDLTWSGSDAHAGIMDFDIHVIEDDTIEYTWRAGVNNHSATFIGRYGVNYKFYSVARDLAGNEELPPPNPVQNPDAQTTLLHPDAVINRTNPNYWMRAYPNPARDAVTIEASLPAITDGFITVTNLAGRTIHREEIGASGPGRIHRSLALDEWAGGLYIVRIEADGVGLYSRLAVIR